MTDVAAGHGRALFKLLKSNQLGTGPKCISDERGCHAPVPNRSRWQRSALLPRGPRSKMAAVHLHADTFRNTTAGLTSRNVRCHSCQVSITPM
ncbi:hypothetical protein ANANG_G00070950 [Anguilla anguilla]|uniref:Uncharacterized protein n=1 Tax=Anguilla anguilla TaxID=7936 RepID=A0A9D3MSV4_ANGAN|nr:hypothetical protein ANANG_G00070950 [Anguilla anguilla]